MNSSAGIRRPAAIAVTGLRKSFGDKAVLDGIDLTVPEGTIFALLGPDGAGKTTVVQILSTPLMRHMQRYPALTAIVLGMPVVFLLIFVYVFGGTLGAGLGHTTGSRAAYLGFVTPGILVLTIAAAAQATAVTVAMDMTTGIIARFRTMSIARASVLTGHVASSMIQSLLGVGVIIGLAFLIGFRSAASPLAWLAAIGLLALTALALTWLTVALGLAAKSVETASNTPMFLLLPFLGSGFVLVSSLPAGLRWFAEYQPFTPVTTAVRQLLLGGAVPCQGTGRQALVRRVCSAGE